MQRPIISGEITYLQPRGGIIIDNKKLLSYNTDNDDVFLSTDTKSIVQNTHFLYNAGTGR